MKRALPALFFLSLSLPVAVSAQTQTLRSDDGTMERMWSLTSPSAGPNDWIAVGYEPPIPFPFRIVRATMYYLDTYCCSGGSCSNAMCTGGADWDRFVIARDNLAVDPAGLTPNVLSPIASFNSVPVDAGASSTSPPWTLTPYTWTLPANTIFDAPGRVFFAVKFFSGDQWMRFAVDEGSQNQGTSFHTADGFASRSSIWAFGNVGMRIVIEPIFNLRLGDNAPGPSLELASASNVPVLAFRVGAGPASTTLTRVRLTGSGTANEATDVRSVRLVVDANANGAADTGETTLASGTFAQDNGTVDLSFNRTLALGTTERWVVVYDLSGSASGGETFRARIAAPSDVSSSLGAPYFSGLIDGSLVTIAGRLFVERGPASMPDRIVPASAQSLATLQVRLRADNEAFQLTGLTLTAAGSLNDASGIGAVRLYADADSSGTLTPADALLGSGTFPGDDGRRSFTFAARTVPANGTLDLIAVYDLTSVARGGDNFRTIVAQPQDVVASGVSSGAIPGTGPRALSGLPVIGNLATVGGALTVALGPASPAAGTAQPGATDVPMMQIVLGADAEPVLVGSIRFTGFGSGDEPRHVARAELWRDQNQNGLVDAGDTLLGSPAGFAQDDGSISFGFAPETIPAGGSRYWLLAYDFNTSPMGGETFAARIAGSAAITASGQASGATIVPSGSFPITGGTRTLLGGFSVMLAPENPAAQRVQPLAQDAPVLALRLSAQGERFDVSALRVTASGSLDDRASVARIELWRDGGLLGARDAADVRLGTATFPSDDGLAEIVFSPAISLAAGASERWLLTYDLAAGAAPGQTFRAAIALGGIEVSGSLSGPATALGLPIASLAHSVGGSLSITQGPLTRASGVATPNATSVAMIQLRLATDLEPITISALTVMGSGSGDEASGITAARLWVDADRDGAIDTVGDLPLGAARTFSGDDGTITFTFADRTIPAGANEDWIVAYDVSATPIAGQQFRVSVLDASSIAARAPSGALPGVRGAPVEGGLFTVLGMLRLARGAQSPNASFVSRGAMRAPILQIEARGEQETFTVRRITVHGQGTLDDVSDLAGLTLYRDANGNGLADASDTILAGPVRFAGDDGAIDFTISDSIASGASATWLITADFSANAPSGRTFRLRMNDASDLAATGFGARQVTSVTGLPLSSALVTVGGRLEARRGLAPLLPRLVRRQTIGTSALSVAFSADVEAATLRSLTLHGSGTGDDARGIARVRLYADADRDGVVDPGEVLLGTGAFNRDDGEVTFTLSESVQPGVPIELLALIDLSQLPVGGETFRLSLDPAVDVTVGSASGAVTPSGAPISGPTITVSGGFEVAAGPSPSTGGPVNQSRQDVPMLQLEIFADNEACTVSELTISASGSANDATDVSEVGLYLDANGNGLFDFMDTALAQPARFLRDDGAVVFTGLSRMLGRGARETWLVTYDLSGRATNGTTLRARLATADDLVVSCDVSGAIRPSGPPIDGPVFTIEREGALVVRRGDQTPPPAFLPRAVVRAELLQLRLRADVREVFVDTITFTASAAGALASLDLFVDSNHDGRLDRGDRLVAEDVAPDMSARFVAATAGLTIGTTDPVDLLAVGDVSSSAAPGTRFVLRLASDQDVSARSSLGAAPVTGAPISSELMTVAGDLNLALSGAAQTTAVHNDDRGRVVLDFTLSAVSERFTIEALTLTAEGTMEPSSAIEALAIYEDLDGDGVPGGTDMRLAGDVHFPQGARRVTVSGLGASVAAGATARWLVVADLAGTARVDETLTLSVAANVDLVAMGDQAGATSPIGAPLIGPTLVIGPSLEISAGMLSDAIVAANAQDIPAISILLQAFNEDVTLSRLSLVPSGTLHDRASIDAVRLYFDQNADGRLDPGDVEIAPSARATADDGAISFSPLSERVVRGTTRALLAAIDLSGRGAAGQTVQLSIAQDADLTAFGSISGAVAAHGAPLEGARLSLVGALNLRRGPASPPGVGVNPGATFPALQIELFTSGEAVNVSQLALRIDGSADDAKAIASAELWADTDSDGAIGASDTKLGSATPDGDDGLVTFVGIDLDLAAEASRTVLVAVSVASDAAIGGTIRLGLEQDDHVRATGASSGAVTPVGAPISGSTFTIVRPFEPSGEAPADEGCGCKTSAGQSRSTGMLALLAMAFIVRRRTFRSRLTRS
jgi:MYXO-CTERM domain-containing protein